MNSENYEYLTELILPRLGFPQALDDQLLAQMKIGGNTITLNAEGYFDKDKMQYAISLELSEDRYFVNSIKATITKENEQPQSHTWTIFSQNGHSPSEMYNMLSDRFVYRQFMKDGEKVGVWSAVDPSKVDNNGNTMMRNYYENTTKFNLIAELGKLPLTYLNQQDKESLILDLRSGQTPTVNIKLPDGSKERVSLVAKPNFGTIFMYNKEGKRIKFDQGKIKGANEQNVVNQQKFVVKGEENKEPSAVVTKLLEQSSKEQNTGKGATKTK